MTSPIKFYSHHTAHFNFSNFARYGFYSGRVYYPTSEHYYQSHKTLDSEQRLHIIAAPTPREAQLRGRKVQLRDDFERVKDKIMYRGLLLKFTTHSNLRHELITTHPHHLIEDSPYDNYWGRGRDNNGKNRLGELLCELRQSLINNDISTVEIKGHKCIYDQRLRIVVKK